MSITTKRIIRLLEKVIWLKGKPENIRCDNCTPHVPINRTVLLIVDDRQCAIVHLYVVFLQYFRFQSVVQKVQLLADRWVPVVER